MECPECIAGSIRVTLALCSDMRQDGGRLPLLQNSSSSAVLGPPPNLWDGPGPPTDWIHSTYRGSQPSRYELGSKFGNRAYACAQSLVSSSTPAPWRSAVSSTVEAPQPAPPGALARRRPGQGKAPLRRRR